VPIAYWKERDNPVNHFKDKVSIVTGGASGIGRALCKELSQREASAIIIADIDVEGAQETASSIVKAGGGRARAAHLDVSQAAAVEKLVDETVFEYGRLDYMFNNAGIAVWGEMRDMSLEHWHRALDGNLWGVIHGTLSAYQVMIRQGYGHIVNTASLAGLIPVPMETAYAAAKHAVVGLSTSLRAEGAGLGVKVSVVCPGPIRTGIFDSTTYVTEFKSKGAGVDTSSMMSADNCAHVILKDVARNKGIIIVTPFARYAWLLYRINPSLAYLLFRKRISGVRASRVND